MNVSGEQYPAPLRPRETWDIVDSTKLKTYMECPRKYFWEYVLGWRREGPNLHFEFGIAFHKAMEVLLKRRMVRGTPGYTQEDVIAAYEAFIEQYRTVYSPDYDLHNAPKDPATAMRSLVAYAERYRDDDFRVLYTEVAGSVFIDETNLYDFKIDVVAEDDDGIHIMDHKTSGIDSNAFREQWHLDVQMAAYTHVLYTLFPPERVFGAKVNVSFIRKVSLDFTRIAVRKTTDMMAAWLWRTAYRFSHLKHDYEVLSSNSANDSIMTAFPMRETSCMKWGLCPYFAYCQSWQNPLQRCGEPPPGYKEEHWNPRAQEEGADWVLDAKTGELVKKEVNAGDERNGGEGNE